MKLFIKHDKVNLLKIAIRVFCFGGKCYSILSVTIIQILNYLYSIRIKINVSSLFHPLIKSTHSLFWGFYKTALSAALRLLTQMYITLIDWYVTPWQHFVAITELCYIKVGEKWLVKTPSNRKHVAFQNIVTNKFARKCI